MPRRSKKIVGSARGNSGMLQGILGAALGAGKIKQDEVDNDGVISKKYSAASPFWDTVLNQGRAGDTADYYNMQGDMLDQRSQAALDKQAAAFKNQEALKLQTDSALRERKLLDLNNELQDLGRTWAVSKGLDPERHSPAEMRDFGLMLKYGTELATNMKNEFDRKFGEQDRAAELRNKTLTGDTTEQKLNEARAIQQGNIEATNTGNKYKTLRSQADINRLPTVISKENAEDAYTTAKAIGDLKNEPSRLQSDELKYSVIQPGMYPLRGPISKVGNLLSVYGPRNEEKMVGTGMMDAKGNEWKDKVNTFSPGGASPVNIPRAWDQDKVDSVIGQGSATPRQPTVAPLDQATEEERLRRMMLQNQRPAFGTKTNAPEYFPTVNPYGVRTY